MTNLEFQVADLGEEVNLIESEQIIHADSESRSFISKNSIQDLVIYTFQACKNRSVF